MDLKLIPLSIRDIEWLRAQRNRPEMMKYFRQVKEISKDEQLAWFNGLNRGSAKPFIVTFGEYHVGYTALNPIDWGHLHAEFSIFITPEHQGCGYGRKAVLELLKYGFVCLGLNKIYSDVLDYPDENRFEFYKALGFKADGLFIQQYKKGDLWVDSIPFSMLNSEYATLYGKTNQDRLEIREDTPSSQAGKEGQSFSYSPG